MTKKPRRIRVGDVYEVKTYAGVRVYQKVIGFCAGDPKGEDYFEACLTRPEDVAALKDASVPYTGKEDPSECVGTLFRHQIIKKISPRSKRRVVRKKRD